MKRLLCVLVLAAAARAQAQTCNSSAQCPSDLLPQCNPGTGMCVTCGGSAGEAACLGYHGGKHCQAGVCVACRTGMNADCLTPEAPVCTASTCVACTATTQCTRFGAGSTCNPTTGHCEGPFEPDAGLDAAIDAAARDAAPPDDAITPPPPDAAPRDSAADASASPDARVSTGGDDSGCGCRTSGRGQTYPSALLTLLAAAAIVTRRRR